MMVLFPDKICFLSLSFLQSVINCNYCITENLSDQKMVKNIMKFLFTRYTGKTAGVRCARVIQSGSLTHVHVLKASYYPHNYHNIKRKT